MKILIIQTARLGDIYLMWPAVRGLKRLNPQAQIHVLVRETYAQALVGLEDIQEVHKIPSQLWIQGLAELKLGGLSDQESVSSFLDSTAFSAVSGLVDKLKAENFDQVINMGFSPLSSWLTKASSNENSEVAGYSRTQDGYLAIPDAMSAYFYAQVGSDRPNRFHLAEIFATLCKVDLIQSDWRSPFPPGLEIELPEEFIAVHVGGSEVHKMVSVSKWISIFSQLRKLRPVQIVLIGGKNEKPIAAQLESSVPEGEIINLVGEIDLPQSMAVLQKARLLVGPDSAPIHMASLTQTPVLNLSLGQVKYWETGPRAQGSVVVSAANETDLASDTVADLIMRVLHGMRLPVDCIQTAPGTPSYTGASSPEKDFEWQLCEAIYMGKDFPAPIDPLFIEGIKRLAEVNQLLLEQTKAVKGAEDLKKRSGIMERCEEVIETVAKLVPSLVPLVRWYMTEKVRIGPADLAKVVTQNLEIQNLLQGVLDIYLPQGDSGYQAEKEL